MDDVYYRAAGPVIEKFHFDPSFVRGIRGPVGCFSGDTEFLTPSGWCRFDEYDFATDVAQWNPETDRITFVCPEAYIRAPCDEFIFFRKRGLSMVLSEEHTVGLWDYSDPKRRNFIKYTASFLESAIIPHRRSMDLRVPLPNRDDIVIGDCFVGRRVSVDGLKYCFQVPTGFLVVRHNKIPFISGNSGKTVGLCFEIFNKACTQVAHRNIRYSRWALIRNTYSELRDTTLQTWMDWFGSCSKVKQTAPMRGKFLWTNPMDGTVIDLELWFIALDKPKDVRKMMSLELTGAALNEAVQMGKVTLDKATERVRRYPGKRRGGITWSGVILDTNSCDDDHWWYDLFEENLPEGYAVFNQPPALMRFPDKSAMQTYFNEYPNYPHAKDFTKDHKSRHYIVNPECENIEGQPFGGDYWLNLVHGKDSKYIEVFLMNQFGTISDSMPIYPEYIDEWHCAKKDIKPAENIGITLGFDFGGTPACSFSQILPSGKKSWFDELWAKEHSGMGIRQFSREVLVPYLIDNYLPWLQAKLIEGWGDPSGKTPVQTDEKTCFMILRECPNTTGPDGNINYHANAEKLKDREWVELLRYKSIEGEVSLGDLGIEVGPAKTNAFIPRIDSVSRLLIGKIDGKAAFEVSPKCKLARKGFNGRYRRKRVQISGEKRYHAEAVKDIFSHLHDGFQADCLMAEYRAHDLGLEQERQQKAKIRENIGNTSAAMWDEVDQMKQDLDDEYDAINDAYWEDY